MDVAEEEQEQEVKQTKVVMGGDGGLRPVGRQAGDEEDEVEEEEEEEGKNREGQDEELRALEFYSGIGGMRHALRRWEEHQATSSSSSSPSWRGHESLTAGRRKRRRWRKGARVCGAWELSGIANDVYEYNGEQRPTEGNISRVTVREVDAHAAQLWLMSPPCQPYTRVGLRRDAADPRARSLLDLLALLPHLSHPPSYLLLENVLGFEVSESAGRVAETLSSLGYIMQTVLVSPNDIDEGEPYSRPRCYVLAKRSPLKFALPHLDGKIIVGMPGRYPHGGEDGQDSQVKAGQRNQQLRIRPVGDFLEADVDIGEYGVPAHVIERWGAAFDIVTAGSHRCCCFTKSYSQYAKGTGSLLATKVKVLGDGWEPITDATLAERGLGLHDLGLRYFTPREIANLHGFSQDFAFPESTTLRQRYALLGNSLSVTVVALLLNYLLTDDVERSDDNDNVYWEVPPAACIGVD